MAEYKQQTKEERLARLKQMQEQLSKLKVGFDSNVLKLKQGTTIVRILPPVGNMDQQFYHQQVGYHMIGATVVRCSEFTTSYEIKCPVCEVNEVLRRGGPKDKAIATKIRLNKKYWMNVIVRNDRDNFDTAEGPLVLKAGVTIFNRTRSLVNDPDYGLIDDPEQGVDIKIEKSGEMKETEYNVNPRKGDYQPLLVGADSKIDWNAIQELMEKAPDLSAVLMPDNPDEDAAFLEELGYDSLVKVYGYERTVVQFGVHLDTIGQLEQIIQANEHGQGGGDEGEEGNTAKPVRGNSNTAKPQAATNAANIRERIAAMQKQGS